MPRLYREAPLNSIWEGSGNVNALDVLRALGREPVAVEALRAEMRLGRTTGLDRRLDGAVTRLGVLLDEAAADGPAAAGNARQLTGLLARTLQGSLLVRAAEGPARSRMAEAFLSSRLEGEAPAVFGRQRLPGAAEIVDYSDLTG